MNLSTPKKVTVLTLQALKKRQEKITCLTAYDYSFAAMLDRAGIDMVMVGDSLGMVMQGHETSLPVTLEEVIYHTECASRGSDRALLIGDLPFGSYQLGPQQACESAMRMMQEGGAEVVKLEGGLHMAETIEFLAARGIPVCAHIGLTPQSVHRFGGFRVQGRGKVAAGKLREDAIAVEAAGASLIVLEVTRIGLSRSPSRSKTASNRAHQCDAGSATGFGSDRASAEEEEVDMVLSVSSNPVVVSR